MTHIVSFLRIQASLLAATPHRYMSREHRRVDLIGSERVKTSITVEHKALRCPYTERHSTMGDVVQMYATRDSRVMVFCPTKLEANEVSLSNCIRLSCQV